MRFVVNFVSHHVYCVDINIFSVIAYCSRSMVSIARSRDRCHPSNEIVFAFSSIDTVPTFRFSHPSEKLGWHCDVSCNGNGKGVQFLFFLASDE
jgi:hypothetical protein